MKRIQNGFTLAELLVVTAIIAVLAAVSIPVFIAQMDKANAAVDIANVRDAKAAAIADYLTSGKTGAATYYYDAGSGTVTTDINAAEKYSGYGKSAKDVAEDNAAGIPDENGKAHIVSFTIAADGTQSAAWTLGSGNEPEVSTASSLTGLKASSSWASYQATFTSDYYNDCIIDPGTIVSENGINYLFYSYNTQYGSNKIKNMSLADLAAENPGRIEVITSAKIVTDADITVTQYNSYWTNKVSAGSIYESNGIYYVAKVDITGHNIPPDAAQWEVIKTGS